MSDDALRATLDRLSMKAAVEMNNGNDAEGWQAVGINYAIHEVRAALASSRPEPLDVVAALKSYRGPFDVSLPIHHSVPLDEFQVERLTPLAEHLRAALASSRPEPLDVMEVAHKAAEIGFTYGALGRDFTYVRSNVETMVRDRLGDKEGTE